MYISEEFKINIIANMIILLYNLILLLLSYIIFKVVIIIFKIIIMIKNFVIRFIITFVTEISIFIIFMYIYKDLLFL